MLWDDESMFKQTANIWSIQKMQNPDPPETSGKVSAQLQFGPVYLLEQAMHFFQRGMR